MTTEVLVLTPEVYSYSSMLVAGALERANFEVSLMRFTSATYIDLLPQPTCTPWASTQRFTY